MEINVESITSPHVKGLARIVNPGNLIQVTVSLTDRVITYHSIQLFANHWRFIEDKPKELLTPAVITFIKNYLALNDVELDNVYGIEFFKYRGFDEIEIFFKDRTITKSIEIKPGLIDFDVINEQEEYTLEQLGIR